MTGYFFYFFFSLVNSVSGLNFMKDFTYSFICLNHIINNEIFIKYINIFKYQSYQYSNSLVNIIKYHSLLYYVLNNRLLLNLK